MKIMVSLMMAVAALLLLSGGAEAARLKDIVNIEGVRDNQLMGFGLVLGLNGTGDSSNRSAFTTQSLVMMLERMGISARDSQNDINVKNVASVMVTTELPPFARQGSRLDVTLSSLGDAKSLEGGTLILTPLKGADGRIYAVAQGPVSIGGISQQKGGGGGQQNHPTVGRISEGAIVEKEVEFAFNRENRLQLSLKNPDFTTANRVVNAINEHLGNAMAKARDSGTLDLGVPDSYKGRVVEFIAELENLQVETDQSARIVINERTGTVVMGENVRISTIALSHGDLTLRVAPQPPAQPTTTSLVEMAEGVTLGDLIRTLNGVGVSPPDLIAILQAIKAAGALQAELQIL